MTEPAQPAQIPGLRLLVLHLAPGALGTVVYVPLAGPLTAAGFPPIAALLVAVALVIIPVELAVIVRASRAEAPGAGRFASIAYRMPMRARDWLVLVPVVLFVSIIGFGLPSVLERPILDSLFGWLPEWFTKPLPIDPVEQYTRTVWTVTLLAYVVLNVFAGPIVEELYFRGYLLPRMTRYGRWAPLLNATLFSLYHFWAPWQFLSRIAGVAPFAYAVWWKRNVYLGMVVHVTLNAIGTASVVALVFSKLG